MAIFANVLKINFLSHICMLYTNKLDCRSLYGQVYCLLGILEALPIEKPLTGGFRLSRYGIFFPGLTSKHETRV
jgi:hypothetical protein